MMENTQKQIIRQSSLKAAIDFYKLKGVADVNEEDVINTAYNFGFWCATGNKVGDNNNKLLK